jgi:uncharacterized protein YndB with AHSA1/START domain
MNNRTTIERKSERSSSSRALFNGPPRIVFEAWTKPELMKLWWAPKSSGVPLLSCEMDVRVGAAVPPRVRTDAGSSFAFFGKYLEVEPPSRLVWTNEESEDAAVTTVTFEEKDGQTLLVLHELYPPRKRSTRRSPGWRTACPSSSNSWTRCSPPKARARDGPLGWPAWGETRRTGVYPGIIAASTRSSGRSRAGRGCAACRCCRPCNRWPGRGSSA